MGRKRKVPAGLRLKNWRDSFDESSSEDENCSQLPPPVSRRSIIRQDLSPTPSAPSTELSNSPSPIRQVYPIPEDPLVHDDNGLAEEEVGSLGEDDSGDSSNDVSVGHDGDDSFYEAVSIGEGADDLSGEDIGHSEGAEDLSGEDIDSDADDISSWIHGTEAIQTKTMNIMSYCKLSRKNG